jgi:PadR family transcriptional regulator, regulatory protein AphA
MLSNTAYVILGILQKGPMSGYDIKSKVDISARFFFTASYGQIYPELKRLATAGLIEGTELRTGRRARTEYELTSAGRGALLEWLREPSAGIEVRDEGLLKFFFGGRLDQDDLLARVAALRAERAADLERIREISRDIPKQADDLQLAVLDYGLGLYQYVIDWCDRIATAFAARNPGEFPVDRWPPAADRAASLQPSGGENESPR